MVHQQLMTCKRMYVPYVFFSVCVHCRPPLNNTTTILCNFKLLFWHFYFWIIFTAFFINVSIILGIFLFETKWYLLKKLVKIIQKPKHSSNSDFQLLSILPILRESKLHKNEILKLQVIQCVYIEPLVYIHPLTSLPIC